MALQLGALRDALIDAGASPEKAERAAEEVASRATSSSVATKPGLFDVESPVVTVTLASPLINHLERRFTRVEATLAIVVALLVAIAVKLFWFH
jgi:hypothetical protein